MKNTATNKKTAVSTPSTPVRSKRGRKPSVAQTTTENVKVSRQHPTYEEIQRSLMDKDAAQEKSLQVRIKSNLRSLQAAIEKTDDTVDQVKDEYEAAIQSSDVDWNNVIKLKNRVANLKEGVKELRELREVLFPNWQNILTQY